MATAKERIVAFIKDNNLTVKGFEAASSLSNGYLRQLRKAPSFDKISKISAAYPQLNMDWVLTGEGEMYAEKPKPSALKPYTPIQKASDIYRMVPLLNIDSVGGFNDYNKAAISEEHIEGLIQMKGARDGDYCIYESGHSMEPTIPCGAIMLVRNVPNWRNYFGFGHPFVLVLSDGRRITKIVRRSKTDPQNNVLCVSVNPEFDDEELPVSHIMNVWQVIRIRVDKNL